MSTISPGIGKCGDNIYDHRREEERVSGESIRRVVASDDQNWPRNYDRRAKGDTGNVVGIWEIGLGRFGLRCGAVNVLKRTKEG